MTIEVAPPFAQQVSRAGVEVTRQVGPRVDAPHLAANAVVDRCASAFEKRRWLAAIRGPQIDELRRFVDGGDNPSTSAEDDATAGEESLGKRRATQFAAFGGDAVFLRCAERGVERVVIHQALAVLGQAELAASLLLDEATGAERLQESGEETLTHQREWAALAQGAPRLAGSCPAMLSHQRKDLLHECREVQSTRIGRLAPTGEEQLEGGDRLHDLGAQRCVRWRPFVELALQGVAPQKGGVAGAPRAAEPLPQAGNRGCHTHLRHALDSADVDAELEGRRAHRARRPADVADGGLGLFAERFRQVSVMRPELVGNLMALAETAQEIRQLLHPRPGVGEDQVVIASQVLEEVTGDGGESVACGYTGALALGSALTPLAGPAQR